MRPAALRYGLGAPRRAIREALRCAGDSHKDGKDTGFCYPCPPTLLLPMSPGHSQHSATTVRRVPTTSLPWCVTLGRAVLADAIQRSASGARRSRRVVLQAVVRWHTQSRRWWHGVLCVAL